MAPKFVPNVRSTLALVAWWIARQFAWWLARPVFVIKGPDGTPYLTRVYLTPKGDWWRKRFPAVFLHFFHRSDHERELHNHPWTWAWSWVCKGGYLEERHDDWPRCYFEGDTNWITERTFHRVQLFDEKAGTWTLFVAGPRHGREWGFLQPDGEVVSFREYAAALKGTEATRSTDPNVPKGEA